MLKKGSKGRRVKEVQTLLDFHGFWVYHTFTENFGGVTEKAVKKFQKAKGLKADGKVGPVTLNELLRGVDADRDDDEFDPSIIDTDNKLAHLGSYTTTDGLEIHKVYMDSDEYVQDYGEIIPKNLFIHHTAGWDNPEAVVNSWNRDSRGRVGTQYVIGGGNIKGNSKHDGKVVECLPDNYIAWHLGKVGSFSASKYSVGIELNSFGYLYEKDGKYYAYPAKKKDKSWRSDYHKYEVVAEQVVDLGYEFRGYQFWHKYSEAQIESLRLLILHIQEIYPSIDLSKGLLEEMSTKTASEAFGYNKDASYAKTYGLWTHTNVRKDKWDNFPQQELVDMLKTFE